MIGSISSTAALRTCATASHGTRYVTYTTHPLTSCTSPIPRTHSHRVRPLHYAPTHIMYVPCTTHPLTSCTSPALRTHSHRVRPLHYAPTHIMRACKLVAHADLSDDCLLFWWRAPRQALDEVLPLDLNSDLLQQVWRLLTLHSTQVSRLVLHECINIRCTAD